MRCAVLVASVWLAASIAPFGLSRAEPRGHGVQIPSGHYTGVYQCGQGATQVAIDVAPGGSGTFSFNAPRASGSYTISIIANGDSFDLKPGAWISRPRGYLLATARVQLSGNQLDGRVLMSGCGEIHAAIGGLNDRAAYNAQQTASLNSGAPLGPTGVSAKTATPTGSSSTPDYARSTAGSPAFAQPKATTPTGLTPTGSGASFRPDFRGTVEYSGSYAGQTNQAAAIDGDFSISLDIFETGEIRGRYQSTGQFGSGRIWGKRTGDTCVLQQSNLIWKGHCGPDGFFIAIASGNGTTSPLQISINAGGVSFPSSIDQAGMRPKPSGPTPFEAILGELSKQAAEDRLSTQRFRIRSNQLAAQAIRNRTNVRSCLHVEQKSTSHTEFGPVEDGLFTVNRNHSVTDYYDAVVNNCEFVIDVKVEGNSIAVAANGATKVSGRVEMATAKPHIFSQEQLK